MDKVIIGNCTLYHGDCLDILPTIKTVDALVTDPPYGIKQANGFSGAGGFSNARGSKPIARREYTGEWDNQPPEQKIFELMLARGNQSIVWGGNYFTDKLPQANFWLVWDKQNTMPTHSDCELAWTNINRNSVKRIVYMQNGCISKEKERFHPTQKPVGVMRWCLTHIPKAKTILDPFMGSGTTGVACIKENRSFIGIEKDKRYFDIACKRIEEAYSQPDMFYEAELSCNNEQD